MGWLGSAFKGLLKGVTSGIPIVGDVVNSIFDDVDREAYQKEQKTNSKELMQYQNDLNLQNWKNQMSFNNYANDTQHMREAGLNVLDYGGSGQTPGIAGVSGASAPDISSLLNYQREMQMLNLQKQGLREENKIKRSEAKASAAEADARVAEAKERELDAKANTKLKNRVGEAPEGEGWLFDEEKNVWKRSNPDTLEVEVLLPGTVREDLIRSRIAKEMDESQLVSIQKELQRFETDLRKQFGSVLTQSQLNAVQAATRQALLSGDIMKLDVDTFKKLGIGPNVIRAITSTAQAFAGELSGLGGAMSMFFK